jgi:hypothetical protein
MENPKLFGRLLRHKDVYQSGFASLALYLWYRFDTAKTKVKALMHPKHVLPAISLMKLRRTFFHGWMLLSMCKNRNTDCLTEVALCRIYQGIELVFLCARLQSTKSDLFFVIINSLLKL